MAGNAGRDAAADVGGGPAAEQARFAAAHDVWTLEVARRFGRETSQTVTVGARRDALDALERRWPWGHAATAGMRRTRATAAASAPRGTTRDDERRHVSIGYYNGYIITRSIILDAP